jgi:F1F0 ATPase subunit 2
MNLTPIISAIAGSLLGLLFFGGLWLTVRYGLSSPRPWLWFLPSLLFRSGVVLAGFAFLAGTGMANLLWCTAGFITAKIIVTIAGRNLDPQGRERRGGTCI